MYSILAIHPFLIVFLEIVKIFTTILPMYTAHILLAETKYIDDIKPIDDIKRIFAL